MSIPQQYRGLALVIIGYDFFSGGGAWKSIHHYFRYQERTNRVPVKLIDRRRPRTLRQFLAAFVFSPRVLFNGMDSFYQWESVLFMLLRRDCWVYLHDTDYMVRQYASWNRLKFRAFRHIVARRNLLCVSEQMKDYYERTFGARNAHVVYETVEVPPQVAFDPARKHVLMIGSIDERKGYPLFSEVAEKARERGLPWQFHWLGGNPGTSGQKLSGAVTWWGFQTQVFDFVRKCDLFLLSSVDDPFPLSCLEALASRRRVAVYRNTGIAEIIDGTAGCAVYEDYTADAALAAAEAALQAEPDPERYDFFVNELIPPQRFAERLDRILGIDART